jgi:glycosidase
MCQMAHSYGVKVLVDVVANHLGNQWVADSLCERSYYYEWEIAGMSAPADKNAQPGEPGYVPYTGEVWAFGGGTTTPGGANASTVPVIDTYYYKDTLKFHPYSIQDNDQPGNVTQGNIGMMDLDTSDPVVQVLLQII